MYTPAFTHPSANMASINLNIEITSWGDHVMEEEARKAPAAAGASTPPPKKEKGRMDAPKKGKKANAATEPVKDSVSKTLNFGGKYDPRGNPFGIFAEDDDE